MTMTMSSDHMKASLAAIIADLQFIADHGVMNDTAKQVILNNIARLEKIKEAL